MVVPPSSGAAPSGFTAMNRQASDASSSTAAAPKVKPVSNTTTAQATQATPQMNGGPQALSARRAEKLDLSTVERRGQPNAAPEPTKRSRPHEIPEAPVFRPTEDEFKDPMEYMRKIAPEGSKYGIVKIIPPDSWNPELAIDTTRFHFRVRRQELNSVEGGTRANLNYLDGLHKFLKQHGQPFTRLPSVDKRPLDLYKLKKAVEARGGFDHVCKGKKWAEIGRDLGYSGKIMSSLSTSLKNSYQRWLLAYEEYLRVAKPGVHQQLELENGGPYTPSPGTSPHKRPQSQPTPSGNGEESAAVRASIALNSTLDNAPNADGDHERAAPAESIPQQQPVATSGFTAVYAGGFTAVNARPTSSGFTPVNGANGHAANGGSALGTPLRPALDNSHASTTSTPEGRNGNSEAPNLKRQYSSNGLDALATDGAERKNKRPRRDGPPTVAGSNMHQARMAGGRPTSPRDRKNEKPGENCESCGSAEDISSMIPCDSCDCVYHMHCLEPPVTSKPDYDWNCPRCLVGTGEFGFEEGEIYSLKAFAEKARRFKETHFAGKQKTETEVEYEFWRLVESLSETVEVEYGADIHSTVHGSGFPTIELQPRDPYSTDPWNLNVLPLYGDSLFKHIKSDISGMTVPWLYVGMVFSTFCWHNEDHYAYSANYQHMGDTKTWYGIPAEDAEKFENAMREAVPELFETQPDLLFQLVTLLPPEKLRKAGVRVYVVDQRAGQFVITFPQAYHAGFNHGFNVNEAVNFAPTDWEPYGEAGVERLRMYRKQPCFSHDELLLTAASRDNTIATAKWLGPALQRMFDYEMETRQHFLADPGAAPSDGADDIYRGPRYADKPQIDSEDAEEDEYVCSHCKAFSFLSRYVCNRSGKVMCLLHAGSHECCDAKETDRYSNATRDHVLYFRISETNLRNIVNKVGERAKVPEAWADKVDKLLEEEPRPQLKNLRTLLNEGERIPFDLPQLPDLKKFVDRCNDWVEEATNYITRKQQSRRKSEKSGRKSFAKMAEAEEREKEYRKVDNIRKLLADADEISFDCPEIATLKERAESVAEFQRDVQEALSMRVRRTTKEYEELLEVGRTFGIDMPEIEQLDTLVQRLKWNDEAVERRRQPSTLEEITRFLEQGRQLAMPETDPTMTYFRDLRLQGELWETKAKEVMSVEHVHYQQLDALSRQATTLPVTKETLEKVESILKKQREAQQKIMTLYEQSRDPDFRKRPLYKDVRDVMAALEELNSKPPGAIDLDKEQKRHEDWMRKGKKLFGKTNAPLHILHQHLQIVQARNDGCFDLRDKPRMPVEPSSRPPSPQRQPGVTNPDKPFPDIFCICRKPEAGMMIECELCHEWYHGRCLKIARGKVKEDDGYTCPICDWRLKIPRDAARPKLEELQAWHDELETLPFQPEEEETLLGILDTAQAFRDYIRPFVNPVAVTPDEIGTLRFYLRKVEGADLLLGFETNFLRQELHKWAPVAPIAPPVIEFSSSTRKPRPTKQQKLMASLGITNPDDLPPALKVKPSAKRKVTEILAAQKGQQPLQPAPGSPAGPSAARTASGNILRQSVTASSAGSTPMRVQHTPSFSYDSETRPTAAEGYRDSPIFAPSSAFAAQQASPGPHTGSHTHLSHPQQHSPGTSMTPVRFSSAGRENYASHTSPQPATNQFSANLDPALFGSSSGQSMFDKQPAHEQMPGDDGGGRMTSPNEFGNGNDNAGLDDTLFADMVHDDEGDKEIGDSHAGEAFAAGGSGDAAATLVAEGATTRNNNDDGDTRMTMTELVN